MTAQNVILWGFDSASQKEAIAKIIESNKVSIGAWFQNCSHNAEPTIHELNNQPEKFLHNYLDVSVPSSVYESAFQHFTEYALIYERHLIASAGSISSVHNKFNASIRIAYSVVVSHKIDTVLFCNMPHEGFDFVLYIIARLLKLSTLVFYQSVFPGKHLIIRDGLLFNTINLVVASEPFSDIKQFLSAGPQHVTDLLFYARDISVFPIPIGISQLFSRFAYGFCLIALGRLNRAANQFRFVESSLRYLHSRRIMFFREIPKDLTYIYFPLHLQPECTTAPMGGIYQDQLLAIEQLSQILPPDWKIVVKENPRQGPSHRVSEFFTRLALIKNLVLVRDINTHLLLDGAVAVATITGTVALEAITSRKPVIVFGNTYMQIVSGVYSFSDDLDLEAIVESHISLQSVDQSLATLATFLHNGIIDEEYLKHSDITSEQNKQLLYHSISSALSIL